MHSIRNFYEEFDSRIYNNLENRNLYVLNLDCDYASNLLQQVISVIYKNTSITYTNNNLNIKSI